MLAVGTCVIYPMHGGARITGIDEHEYDGKKTKYYILTTLCNKMTVSVPVESAERLGMRMVAKPSVAVKIAAALHEQPDVQKIKSVSWNRRLQLYIDKLKTGDILEVARIYKVLKILDGMKKISVGERRLLRTSKSIIISELMLMNNESEEKATQWVEEKSK